MGGLSLEVALALVCAVTFFRAGRFESAGEAHDHSALWALRDGVANARPRKESFKWKLP